MIFFMFASLLFEAKLNQILNNSKLYTKKTTKSVNYIKKNKSISTTAKKIKFEQIKEKLNNMRIFINFSRFSHIFPILEQNAQK